MVGEESTSAVFQIVQIEPTVSVDFPKMQERKEGQELVLTAKFDGSPPPTAVWLLEGEEIKADGERIIITEEESEDGKGMVTTLRITKVADEDNGKYTLLIKVIRVAFLLQKRLFLFFLSRSHLQFPLPFRIPLVRPRLIPCLMLWASPNLPGLSRRSSPRSLPSLARRI